MGGHQGFTLLPSVPILCLPVGVELPGGTSRSAIPEERKKLVACQWGWEGKKEGPGELFPHS